MQTFPKFQRLYQLKFTVSPYSSLSQVIFPDRQSLIDYVNSFPAFDFEGSAFQVSPVLSPQILPAHLYYFVWNFEEQKIEYFSQFSVFVTNNCIGGLSLQYPDGDFPGHAHPDFNPSVLSSLLHPFQLFGIPTDKYPLYKFYHVSLFDVEVEYEFVSTALPYYTTSNELFSTYVSQSSFDVFHERDYPSPTPFYAGAPLNNFANRWHQYAEDVQTAEQRSQVIRDTVNTWSLFSPRIKFVSWNDFVDMQDFFGYFEQLYPGCFDSPVNLSGPKKQKDPLNNFIIPTS